MSTTDRAQTNGIFQINVDSKGKQATWVIDLKDEGKVTKGSGKKPGESRAAAAVRRQGKARWR